METNINIKRTKTPSGIFSGLGRILSLMKRRKLLIALSIFEVLRGFAMVQGMSWGLKLITDGVVGKESKTLSVGIIMLASTIILTTASVIFIDYSCLNTTIKTKSDIRKLIMRSFMGTAFESIEKFKSGDMVYRLNNNVNEVAQLYRSLYFFIGSFGKVTGSLVVGFTLSWQLSLTMITLGIVKISVDRVVIKRLQDIIGNIKNVEAKLINEVMEYIKGSVFFRIFGNKQKISGQFDDLNHQYSRENMREAAVQARTAVIMQVFEFGAILAVLWVGSILVLNGKISIGSLTAFIGMYDNLINPYRFIGDFMKSYKSLRVSYERVEEITTLDPGLECISPNEIKPSEGFSLVADNVTFGYGKDSIVLDNLCFKAKSGEITYIIGKSGVGKTTLFRLLMGFKRPIGGNFYIETSKARIPVSLNMLTHISQNPFLFNGTVWENITLEDCARDRKSAMDAAARAGIHDYILTLPDGYDTIITDGGKQLSGGQKCRISLARAFYRATPVILLDEVFASLDNNTIDLVQKSIESLAAENKCILMISHRHEWIKPGAIVLNLETSRMSNDQGDK